MHIHSLMLHFTRFTRPLISEIQGQIMKLKAIFALILLGLMPSAQSAIVIPPGAPPASGISPFWKMQGPAS